MTARIGITGAHGLLGWHLRAHLHGLGGYEVVAGGRTVFDDDRSLDDFVSGCDAVVHLAGMNRGDVGELEATNGALAAKLVAALERGGGAPQVVFANSVHRGRDDAYGRSKRRASGLLADWARVSGAAFTDLVLPHVYGEGGRPYYNSAVSTFCHQIAGGQEPSVRDDANLELLHAQDFAAAAVGAIDGAVRGELRVAGEPLTVGALAAKLSDMDAGYAKHRIPDVRLPLDRNLFNTLRSYMFPARYPMPLPRWEDERGVLVETVKSTNGGQTFVSSTHPGVTRGNHFHLRKVERFVVVSGRAVIRVRKLFDPEVHEFPVDGSEPAYVDIPTLHTHSITNVGAEPLVTFFWAHEIFDPAAPDTTPEPVVAGVAGP